MLEGSRRDMPAAGCHAARPRPSRWEGGVNDVFYIIVSVLDIIYHFKIWNDPVITSFQMRAARALLGIDQRALAELAGVSLPTIQRMEASVGNVRGVVESLTRVVDALNRAGVELIGEHARSEDGGRGVRLKEPGPPRRM
jgi:DNA-binding XRE family transcriptional regulator